MPEQAERASSGALFPTRRPKNPTSYSRRGLGPGPDDQAAQLEAMRAIVTAVLSGS